MGAVDLAALKAELDTDPNGRGYAELLAKGVHNKLADLLNEPAGVIDRQAVPVHEVRAGIDPDEFVLLPVESLHVVEALFAVLAGQGLVASLTVKVVDAIIKLFPKDGTTATALTVVKSKPATYAERLFGEGITITAQDIGIAYKQPDREGLVNADTGKLEVFQDGVKVDEESLATAKPEVAGGNFI